MSYQNDIFIDTCIMRLAQLAAAIRQNNDAIARQELDAEELDRMERELDRQSFDIENNA